MNSYARSITLSAALIVAMIIGVLVVASPPQGAPGGSALQASEAQSKIQNPKSKIDAIAPISMSDPDGQELILEELSARVAVQGMLSLTELEFRFRNPQNRRIEGRFACTLPPNAAISRFAKEVNGQLMEGEVVERLRANQVYEQFLHQMRDPALLEQDQGNRFSARIFPIEANATTRLVLSYTTLLPMRDGVRTYSLPLRGMAKVGRFSFRAFVTALPGEESTTSTSKSSLEGPTGAARSTAEVISLDERDYTPPADIVLSWRPTAAASRARTMRAGDYYVAAFRPDVRSSNFAAPGAWLFYVDTSASSAEGSEHRIHALESLLAALPANDRVQVNAFDQEIVSLANGSASDLSRSIGGLLRARLFLGGTDLGTLFADVSKSAQQRPDRAIVVASDLVATLGNTERKDLTDAMRAIPAHAMVHALILGSREETAIAKALTAGRGRIVSVPFTETLDAKARDAAAELRKPIGQSFDVADSAAEWMYPTHFDDVQNGDEVIVLGKLKVGGDPAARLLSGGDLAASASTLPAGTFGPLLEREAYRAYLEYLAEREASEPSDAVRRALATEQVKISIEQRVVIPRTTMLVLETEWDYRRFGLDRRALAAILTIDAGGIGRLDRHTNEIAIPVTIPPPPTPPPPPMPRQKASAARPPASLPPPDSAAEARPVEERVEAGVEGGVVGGVVGGVAGGVVGGVVGGAPSQPAVAESITVGASAPSVVETTAVASNVGGVSMRDEPPASFRSPPPSPVVAPEAPRREIARGQDSEAKRSGPDWTKRQPPSRARVDELEKALKENPRDRERYNQLSEVLAALGDWNALRSVALRWQPYDPENPQVYEVLGMADERLGNESEAARANASIIEVAPGKTELLQRAGLLLLRNHRARLAETPLRHALELRPDRVNGYRHLALMLWREGRIEEAARVLESATRQSFPNWYGNAARVVREELGYVYRAWIAKEPSRRAEIEDRARDHSVDLNRRDALRVTLAWETDANDVDLHVVDPKGEECYYGHKSTSTGLELYEDITQGLGPEVVRTDKLVNGTYHVGVRYFAAGPMGVSRGIVVVMRGDDVDIYPFRLVEGGGDIRYVAAVTVK